MGVFQADLGVPDGYGEWLVGDEAQYRLAKYSLGGTVVFNDYEWDVLDRITDPALDSISRPERSGLTGRTAMALYVRETQVENRWGDRPLRFLDMNIR